MVGVKIYPPPPTTIASMASRSDQAPSTIKIEDLLAREEIHDTLKRYVRAADRADAELMVSCYHKDGYDDHGSFRGSASDFANFVCGERSRRYGATHHILAQPNIALSGLEAHVDTYCIAHHITVPDDNDHRFDHIVGLRYLDRFENRSGRWLIVHRTAVYDWTYSISIDEGVSRDFGEDWTIGSRDRTDPWYRITEITAP